MNVPFIPILVALGVAQAVTVLLTADGVPSVIAMILAVATAAVAYSPLSRRVRAALLVAFMGAAFVNFLLHVTRLIPPIQYRLVQLLILGLFGALALSAVVAALSTRAAQVFAACVSSLLTALVVEAILESREVGGELIWVGRPVEHSVLGDVYAPNSVLRTLYPDNPRGYFDEVPASPWVVQANDPGSSATLLPAQTANDPLHVIISEAKVPTLWHIQLNHPGIRVEGGQPYALSFRARADSPRPISYGVAMAHSPWRGLGFYQETTLDVGWRDYSTTFVLSKGDANARLHFDLGARTGHVEVDRVELRDASGVAVRPEPRTDYSVEYRFNSLGCRGPEYPIPRPPDRRRILAIGDSFTLAVGVHQADTFSSQLEKRLNAGTLPPAVTGYDVINCGVSGYATRDERLYYELIGSQYDPQVVLLTMIFNDNMSWHDEVRGGFVRTPAPYEAWSIIARKFREALHEGRQEFDYSDSANEVLKLAEAARARNARLAVAIFRLGELEGPWKSLVTTVSSRLKGTNIPLIDLGEALSEFPGEMLEVHRVDGHPNQIAHRIAAETLERFLRSQHLVQ